MSLWWAARLGNQCAAPARTETNPRVWGARDVHYGLLMLRPTTDWEVSKTESLLPNLSMAFWQVSFLGERPKKARWLFVPLNGHDCNVIFKHSLVFYENRPLMRCFWELHILCNQHILTLIFSQWNAYANSTTYRHTIHIRTHLK